MTNYYEKKKVTGAIRHRFGTPLFNFQIEGESTHNIYRNDNKGNLFLTETNIDTRENFETFTNIVFKAAKLLRIRHLFYSGVFKETPEDFFNKLNWKSFNKELVGRNPIQFEYHLVGDTSNADIKNLTIDTLIGKNEAKETKKVLENISGEGESNIFSDKALDGPINGQGFDLEAALEGALRGARVNQVVLDDLERAEVRFVANVRQGDIPRRPAVDFGRAWNDPPDEAWRGVALADMQAAVDRIMQREANPPAVAEPRPVPEPILEPQRNNFAPEALLNRFGPGRFHGELVHSAALNTRFRWNAGLREWLIEEEVAIEDAR